MTGWGIANSEVPHNIEVWEGYRYSNRFLQVLRKKTGHLEPAEQAALNDLKQKSQEIWELLSQRPLGDQTELAA